MRTNLLWFLGPALASLIFLATADAQEGSGTSARPKTSEPPPQQIDAAQILGIWASEPDAIPFLQTYEFKSNGTCESKAFLSTLRYYVHDGNSIKSGPVGRNQPEQVWAVQLDGNRLTLKFSDDLPVCPFHRSEGDVLAPEALVGVWEAEKCGDDTWTPASMKLKVQTSNAVYSFTKNGLLYIRSRLEDAEPYAVKENIVLCPAFGAKGNAFHFVSQNGVNGLVANGVAKPFVRATPGDIALRQYHPGDPTKENLKLGDEAYADFQLQLGRSPNDADTLEKTGRLLLQMAAAPPVDAAKFEESKKFFKRRMVLLPNDADSYYMVGCIDWTLAFRANAELRLDYNKEHLGTQIRDVDPLPAATRSAYVSGYASAVNEGIDNLKKALALRPDDRDELAVLNLLYRQKADLAESDEGRADYLKQADDLVAKVNSTRPASSTSSSIPLPSCLQIALPLPPPPPPPPDSRGASGGVPGGVPSGTAGGVIGGVIGGMGAAPPPPKPTQTRIRQSGNVTAAGLINRVTPEYPPLARQTGIQGVVRLHAIIGKDGTVESLEVISGHPLLLQAALDAVRQWAYKPTLLNGEPVEVDTTIDVIFALSNPNAPKN